MAFAQNGEECAGDFKSAAPIRMVAFLTCATALFCGRSAHAQVGLKQLPDANRAIETKPPTERQLFRLESESALRQRMIAEARRANAPLPIFPPEPPAGTPYSGRSFSDRATFVEPSNICYRRLYFEQINSERYGWDLTVVQPLVSLGVFYFDVAALPLRLLTAPCRCYECSAGYCLPGDGVPLLLYPPEILSSKAARASCAASAP